MSRNWGESESRGVYPKTVPSRSMKNSFIFYQRLYYIDTMECREVSTRQMDEALVNDRIGL